LKIHALVVDDEPLARRSIRRFLDTDLEIGMVSECGDGESAVNLIRAHSPDLVLLDVQMPEMDGFQVVGRIGPEKMPVTVFVTAYDRYALRAFEANAIDYVLKPFSKERFARAMARAKDRILQGHDRQIARHMLAVLEQIKKEKSCVERLPIPESGRIVFLDTEEIDWIEAQGNYAILHVGARHYEIRDSLACLEQKLNPRRFLRIHRSTIVNVNRIKELRPWFHGYHLILLNNGQKLRMSRYQREIAKRLGIV
jgi:two-component system, LytTR family, response regulator